MATSVIYQEFHKDLDRIKQLIVFLKSLRLFGASAAPGPGSTEDYHVLAADVHKCISQSVSDFPIICGGLQVVLGGRFESFVREVFEDVADAIAQKATTYQALPDQMKKSMRECTVDAIQNQNRYAFTDSDIAEFVRNLADSMNGTVTPVQINSRCMSLTSTNMRPKAFKDLLKRIGYADIWEKMSAQADLLAYCGTMEVRSAGSTLTEKLDRIMVQRNGVTHPNVGSTWSAGTTWPTLEQVEQDVEFLEVFAKEYFGLMNLYESTYTPPSGVSAVISTGAGAPAIVPAVDSAGVPAPVATTI